LEVQQSFINYSGHVLENTAVHTAAVGKTKALQKNESKQKVEQ
jgi:hypothetical protein